MRDLFATGRTPCRPEIDDHDLVTEILQGHCLAFQAGERELRRIRSCVHRSSASSKCSCGEQRGKKCDQLPILHHSPALTIWVGTTCDNFRTTSFKGPQPSAHQLASKHN